MRNQTHKNFQRKVISFFLAVLLMALTFSTLCAAKDVQIQKNVPQVNVPGLFGTTVYEDTNDTESNVKWPISDGRFLELIKDESKDLIRALLTLDGDSLENIIPKLKELFSPFALNPSGELENNTGIKFIWPKKETIKKDSRVNFYYDWRLNPLETADELDRFIDYVREASGCEKVALSGHSCGGVIVTSYLSKYGTDKLQSVFFVSSAGLGATFLGELMSGELSVKGDSVESFLKYLFTDTEYQNLKTAAFSILNRYGVADALLNIGNSSFSKSFNSLLNDFLIPIFGTWPTIWAMVPDDYVEKAKRYVFENIFTDNGNDYTGLIEKIENYNKTVRERRTAMLLTANEHCNLGVFSCYGYSAVPATPSWFIMTDGIVDTKLTSLGATTASYGKTLSKDYLNSADEKFISPDKSIDASTCLFPKQTWFVKNYRHKQFHDDLYSLMDAVLYSEEQMTVDTYEKYPQFLIYDDKSGLVPDSAAISPEQEKRRSFIDAMIELFELIAKWFNKLFKSFK